MTLLLGTDSDHNWLAAKIWTRLMKIMNVKDKAKKQYLENICDEITAFHRTGHYDLTYMDTKELMFIVPCIILIVE